MSQWQPGNTIAERYAITHLVAEGRRERYLGNDASTGHTVCIELFPSDSIAGPDGIAAFRRSVELSMEVASNHVVRPLHVSSDHGLPFIVWEDVVGRPADEIVMDGLPLTPRDAVDVVAQAALGLSAMHARGVLHLAVSPKNLVVGRTPFGAPLVRVRGMGILQAERDGSGAKRMPYESPLYLAPEQLRNDPNTGPPADVWGLGVTLFELTTGQLPFVGENLAELFKHVLEGEPKRMIALRPDAPPALEAFVDSLLQRDVSARPTARAVAEALSPLVCG